MSDPNARGRHLPTLDGWRAVAITAVIISHAQGTLTAWGLGDPRILRIAGHGRLGVDLFFAISGFLICNRLLDEDRLTGTISLRGFYLRRSFRILPLYFAYLVILCFLALAAQVPVSRAEIWSCALFYKNYAMYEGKYTDHFWSLSVEEHFYLMWPFFLLLVGTRRALWITPVIGGIVHCWRTLDSRLNLFATMFPNLSAGIVFRTDTRIDALLWGCFAALMFSKYHNLRFPSWVQWTVLIGLLGCIFLHAPALPLILVLLFPLLIVSTVTNPDTVLGRFLELRPLCWVGRLSYSLYVCVANLVSARFGEHRPRLAPAPAPMAD